MGSLQQKYSMKLIILAPKKNPKTPPRSLKSEVECLSFFIEYLPEHFSSSVICNFLVSINFTCHQLHFNNINLHITAQFLFSSKEFNRFYILIAILKLVSSCIFSLHESISFCIIIDKLLSHLRMNNLEFFELK